VTKDRPRNRSGSGGKSGGFRGRGGGDKPWTRSSSNERTRDERPKRGAAPEGGGDKPWTRPRAAADATGASPRRFQDKPPSSDSQRDKFRGKRDGDIAAERSEIRSQPERGRDKPDRKRDGASRPHQRDPRRGGGRPRHGAQYERRDAAFEEGGEVWIWGAHAASAAMANPKRRVSEALMTRNAAQRAGLDPDALPAYAKLLEGRDIDERLPPGALHQGLAVRCAPLDGLDITDAAVAPDKPLVILDQVTDPQNVGAVFRSAAAFGLGGVVMQTRNAPALGGALAKAAAGAIERVEEIRAVNISRAIDALRDAGWRVIGLDGAAEQTLEQAFGGDEPLAIVLGAEGAGIRPGVAKACTGMARIAIGEAMESLNVSNAAAIAFYEASRRGGAAPPPPKARELPLSEADADERAEDSESD
jgi:23S rRNA (guanosine2251-2'-O)-methyltransferase